jgi:hypothetical protein
LQCVIIVRFRPGFNPDRCDHHQNEKENEGNERVDPLLGGQRKSHGTERRLGKKRNERKEPRIRTQ